jgi:hypothetical protein
LDNETAAFIKSILRAEKQPVSGTKAVLFDRLRAYACE